MTAQHPALADVLAVLTTVRFLAREGFTRPVAGSAKFAYAVTEKGIAAYDEIFKRRNALPDPDVEVDDG